MRAAPPSDSLSIDAGGRSSELGRDCGCRYFMWCDGDRGVCESVDVVDEYYFGFWTDPTRPRSGLH